VIADIIVTHINLENLLYFIHITFTQKLLKIKNLLKLNKN